MRAVSCTVTVGEGSERHNHDLDYRETLEHVHGSAEDVIELIPYRSYKEQINEMMKPYIDEYNRRQQERYQAAWDRYNAGEIRTKPRKRDYQPMGYDYYTEHLHDTYHDRAHNETKELPMFRSLIFGLGDKADRENGIISAEEAEYAMRKLVEQWQQLFPAFRLLGATLHRDEEGFYHCHLDYKPLYERDFGTLTQEQGLRVGIGQEAALEHMGYEPEQSIINQDDKTPIRFNAFRNAIYRVAEQGLHEQGIMLEYGVSGRKEPGKDSSRNQRLESWQATQDAAREAQHQMNIATSIIEGNQVLPEDYKRAAGALENLDGILRDVEESPRTRMGRQGHIISFHLFDQLKSFVHSLQGALAQLWTRIKELEGLLGKRDAEIQRLTKVSQLQLEEIARHEEYEQQIASENRDLRAQVASLGGRDEDGYISSVDGLLDAARRPRPNKDDLDLDDR